MFIFFLKLCIWGVCLPHMNLLSLHPMCLSQTLSFCPCSIIMLCRLPSSPKFTPKHRADLCKNHQQPPRNHQCAPH